MRESSVIEDQAVEPPFVYVQRDFDLARMQVGCCCTWMNLPTLRRPGRLVRYMHVGSYAHYRAATCRFYHIAGTTNSQ